MTLDKAIEILAILESRSQNYSTMFKKDALKLGIEALKGVKRVRKDQDYYFDAPLPGETEK